jgi:hypothetical protein
MPTRAFGVAPRAPPDRHEDRDELDRQHERHKAPNLDARRAVKASGADGRRRDLDAYVAVGAHDGRGKLRQIRIDAGTEHGRRERDRDAIADDTLAQRQAFPSWASVGHPPDQSIEFGPAKPRGTSVVSASWARVRSWIAVRGTGIRVTPETVGIGRGRRLRRGVARHVLGGIRVALGPGDAVPCSSQRGA